VRQADRWQLDVKDVLCQIVWFNEPVMLPTDADGNAMIDKRYVVLLE
jgi:hypothetical protein